MRAPPVVSGALDGSSADWPEWMRNKALLPKHPPYRAARLRAEALERERARQEGEGAE